MVCHNEPKKKKFSVETPIANLWENTDQRIYGKFIFRIYKSYNYDKFYKIDDDKNDNDDNNDFLV